MIEAPPAALPLLLGTPIARTWVQEPVLVDDRLLVAINEAIDVWGPALFGPVGRNNGYRITSWLAFMLFNLDQRSLPGGERRL